MNPLFLLHFISLDLVLERFGKATLARRRNFMGVQEPGMKMALIKAAPDPDMGLVGDGQGRSLSPLPSLQTQTPDGIYFFI